MKRLVLSVFVLGACGAQKLKVEPVTVAPIHMTIDVNVRDHTVKPAKSDPDER
jgi:hypothetical protein